MESRQDLVLVTGVTGKQGGAVARELVASGVRVRGMTRHPESDAARAMQKLGVEIVAGDFDDEASVKRALVGAWGAFSVQNTLEVGVEREEEQGKRFAKLAREAGIQHLVYSSVASAHRQTGIPHFENKWRIEQTIRDLGFPTHVVLRPVFFMENLTSPSFVPAIQQGQLAVGMEPTTVLQMIAVQDIGRVRRMGVRQAPRAERTWPRHRGRSAHDAGNGEAHLRRSATSGRVRPHPDSSRCARSAPTWP
mgnify:CR=1 FL=1